MQSRILFLALSATLASTQTGHAQESSDDKFYADVGYSRVGSDLLELDSFAPSVEYGGLNGHVGYQFSEHWSVEGEAIVGVENNKQVFRGAFTNVDGSFSYTGTTKTDLTQLVGVYVKGTLPITGKLNAFARTGLANAEFDYSAQQIATDVETAETTTSSFDGSFDETGIALGVGLSYDVTDKIYLRSDYTQYDFGDSELYNVGLGVGIRF